MIFLSHSYPSLSYPACHPISTSRFNGLRAVLGQTKSGLSVTGRCLYLCYCGPGHTL
jgi:hypothetical protein